MGSEQEKDALRAVRVETEKLSELAKSFYAAVTKKQNSWPDGMDPAATPFRLTGT